MVSFKNIRWFSAIAVIMLIANHCASVLQAQAVHPHIELYTSEAHGGGSISGEILEAPSGAIYLANEAGLLKYDGHAWTKMPATNHASLVMSATIDAEGRIWIAGIASIGYYHADASGRYTYKDLTESIRALPESSNLGTFWKIRYARDSLFLITTNYVLQWKGGSWNSWSFQDKRRILPSWCDGELYIHDRGIGLYRFTGDRFELLVPDTPAISSGIIAVMDHNENGLLCATVSNGFWRLKGQEFVPTESDLDNATIIHATKLKNGDFALGTTDQGLIILDQAGRLSLQSTVNKKPIYSCFESSYGSIWVVGSDKVYEIKNRSLTYLDDRAQDLLQANNRIYYTTGHQLKSIVPSRGGMAVESLDEAPSLWDIALADGDIVYGSSSSLRSMDRSGLRPPSPSPRAIASIVPSKVEPGSIYTADVPKVSHWKKRNNTWQLTDTLTDFNQGMLSLVELPDSKLLISDLNGALHLANSIHDAQADGKWAALRQLGPDDGLPDPLIWAYCLRHLDTVLVITDRGLYRYDHETESLLYDPLLGDDLGSDAYGLECAPLADGSGWALRLESRGSTGKQKNRVGRLLLDKQGGLRWEPWHLPALSHAGKVEALLHEEREGQEVLWVGGSKRLMRYELSSLPQFEPVATAITAIRERIGSKTYFAGAGTASASYEWDYPQQSLRIEYAAPPSAIGIEGYQTRLVGFNNEWSETAPGTFSDFTNLKEGNYRFEVRAVDEFGREGSTQSLRIRIHPPWYRTTYAYAAGCCAFGFFIWGSIRLRSRHLIRRNEELEQLVNERTYKIEHQKLDLERAKRAKENFLASMSHEIRNPLNGILGIVRLMHQQEQAAGNESKEVSHLYTSASHLHQLIGQTLDYSSLESGKLQARYETFEACKLIDEVITMHHSIAESKGLELASTKPETPCYWKSDPVLLKQILINLVSNAIKYTKEGSVRLNLSYEKHEDSATARFEVSDTGPGIPADKRAYIFEEFTRLSQPGESSIPGTGLGLSIASEMSKLIGGTLRLDPDYDAGARFQLEVELELDLHAQVTSERFEHNSDWLKGQSALVADDLDFNRYIHAEVLSRMGAATRTASNGPEALELLREHRFEIALLDVNMPGMSGLDLARKYRATCGEVNPPVLIALSAYNSPDMEAQCLDSGFDHFLEKPLDPSKLISLLGHSRPSESNASSMLDYIADGDPAALAKLEADYRQSLHSRLADLQDALDAKDVPLQRDLIHTLIGLSSIRKDEELTDILRHLSNQVKCSAPEADVETTMQRLHEQIQSTD